MNKVLILREKYPKISQPIFNHFVESDTTPTKKYLSYMLKLWSNKKGANFLSNKLTETVMKFDELLLFIENKDIYSPRYDTFSILVQTIEKAKEIKEEKSFIREENITILLDTDDFLFIVPKTYRGSLKYGASTKWCTASKDSDNYFKSYTNKGSLCYLIDKVGNKLSSTSKIGFFIENNGNELQTSFKMYNERDIETDINTLIKNNWSSKDILIITTIFRNYAFNNNIIKNTKKSIEKTINNIKEIDLNELFRNMKFIEKTEGENQSQNQEIINQFLKSLDYKP